MQTNLVSERGRPDQHYNPFITGNFEQTSYATTNDAKPNSNVEAEGSFEMSIKDKVLVKQELWNAAKDMQKVKSKIDSRQRLQTSSTLKRLEPFEQLPLRNRVKKAQKSTDITQVS